MRLLQTVRALSLGALLVTAGVIASSDEAIQAHSRSGKTVVSKVKRTTLPSSPATALENAPKLTPPPPPQDSGDASFRKLVVKNLGPVINTETDDFGPTITADGRTLFFVSRREGGLGGDDFWLTMTDSDQDTTWAQPLDVTGINTEHADGAASIAADGQTIYMSSNRDNPDQPNDQNLYVATLDGTQWKNVREVGAPVNSTAWESHPSISPDGKRLFFASNRPGRIGPEKTGNIDIFVSRQMADGRWSEPVNLGSKINTGGYEASPFIATDGATLYFASDGHKGLGATDIFRSEWKGPSDSDWTVPEALPAPINSTADDLFLTVPASGDVLYFTSTREGGSGVLDLYLATNPPPPKSTLVLRGVAFDVNTNEKLGAKVVVVDEQTNDTVYNKYANSSTGEYLVVLSPNSRGELGGSYLVMATESNHFPYPPTPVRIPMRNDTSRIITHDIPMNNEEPPLVRWVTTTPQIVKDLPDRWPGLKGVVIKERETIELFTLLPMVFFDEANGNLRDRYVKYSSPAQTTGFTEDTLTATMNAYYNYLNIMGQRLRANPTATIKLVGTNSMDIPGEKSTELSRQRAESVKKYLVEIWGIDPGRIKLEARNLPENATLATTPEGIDENRRVELSSDSWEIMKPVLFKQNVKVPDHRTVKFDMTNGLREEVIARRELIISHGGRPWKVLTDLGPISAKESPEWNWRNEQGRLMEDEEPMLVQLKVIDKNGREVLSNVDKIDVRQFTQRDVVALNLGDKTREIYNLILFKYNSSDMGKWNRLILDSYVFDRIKPSSDVAVNGYTDILGTPEYNAKLSTNRANAVKGDIAGKIKGKVKSLTAHGFGKTSPLYDNETPEGRYYNRTVQVLVETPINTQ